MTSIEGPTLDDLLRDALHALKMNGHAVAPTKGPNRELLSVQLRLGNPRARLSRSIERGKPFSALGEFCWYMHGSDRADDITYYIKDYPGASDSGAIASAYGPRIHKRVLRRGGDGEYSQFENVIKRLRESSDTRRAVMQLFDSDDLNGGEKEVPCTCYVQFVLRQGRLHAVVAMRSNDMVLGLPHDVFAFTMMQELIARTLGAEVGEYYHFASSLHLYDTHQAAMRRFEAEGYHATDALMPEMPVGDPWDGLSTLLTNESRLRRQEATIRDIDLSSVDPYWADLIRLLGWFQARRRRDVKAMQLCKDELVCDRYALYLHKKATS